MKHAYLIIANKNPHQLQLLISMIDDLRNDIFIMIDKKSKNFPRQFSSKYSNIFVLKSIDIYWGTYSQVQAEINLFKTAHDNYKYEYYHLLSGMDLPLATQDEIHDFFDRHPNKEFIKYTNVIDLTLSQILRIKIFDAVKNFGKKNKTKFLNKNKVRRILEVRIKRHFLKNRQKSNNLFIKLFISIERNLLLLLPQFKINRNNIEIASQWLSIDDELVQLIIKNEKRIKSIYISGVLSDEIFIPTLLNKYPYEKNKVYDSSSSHFNKEKLQGNLRYINWWDVDEGQGSPYVWKTKDFDTLLEAKNNGHLFARKFDENIDDNIIKLIYKHVMKNKNEEGN